MGRILFILVLLAVSFYVVKLIRTKMDEAPKEIKKDTKTTNNNMVKCLHCGLHIPEEEAIKQGDKTFCSLEHAKEEL